MTTEKITKEWLQQFLGVIVVGVILYGSFGSIPPNYIPELVVLCFGLFGIKAVSQVAESWFKSKNQDKQQ